uniref:HEAT repeat-containing protein 1 n=1 Tax=Sphenodon punctatus TaxID=8508 RepID=A0A8D0HKF9_SPHPU
MDGKSKDYLHLLLELFDVIVCGASEGSNAIEFRGMMKLLFKAHLKEPEDLFRFMSFLWTYGYNLSNQLNYRVNAVLQTRALYIGCAIFTTQTVQKKKQLASAASPVVISLLINLGSPVSEVRRAALNCLQSLSGIKESPFHPILYYLAQKAEEIISDPTYVAQALGTLFEEMQTQSKQQKKLLEALELLLDCVQSRSCPSYIARNLMKILHEVNGEMVLSHLLPAVGRLLENSLSSPQTVLKDEAVLFHLLLGKYNEHSASFLCKYQQSLDLFVKALHASQEIYKGIPTFQITALGQVGISKT